MTRCLPCSSITTHECSYFVIFMLLVYYFMPGGVA
jgi:hypothetical protein